MSEYVAAAASSRSATASSMRSATSLADIAHDLVAFRAFRGRSLIVQY